MMLPAFITFIVETTVSGECDIDRIGCRSVEPLQLSIDSPKRSSPVPIDRCDIADEKGELRCSFGDKSILAVGPLGLNVRCGCCILGSIRMVVRLYPSIARVVLQILQPLMATSSVNLFPCVYSN